MVLALLAALALSNNRPLTDRYAFAAQCQKLKERMPSAEVKRILGPPEEVVQEPPSPDNEWTPQCYWRYGVSKPHGFASNGTLLIVNGRLRSGPGGLPPKDLPDEKTLRAVLQSVDDGANQGPRSYRDSDEPPSFNPLKLIRAENALIALGPKKGLATLHEYLRVREGPTNWIMGDSAFALIQTIFEVPSKLGYVESSAIGAIMPGPPKDRKTSPYWPCIVYQDVPFWAFMGAALGGVPEPISWYLDRLEKSCAFRTKPLTPGETPWDVDKHLWIPDPKQYDGPIDSGTKRKVRYEVLNLLATAYHRDIPPAPYYQPSLDDKLWADIVRELKASGIYWDASKQFYVRHDGTTIGGLPLRREYVRRYWRPAPLVSYHAYVSLVRRNDGAAVMDLSWNGGFKIWKGNMVRALTEKGALLESLPTDDPFYQQQHWNASQDDQFSTSAEFRVPRGQKVILELLWKGKTIRSKPLDTDAVDTEE